MLAVLVARSPPFPKVSSPLKEASVVRCATSRVSAAVGMPQQQVLRSARVYHSRSNIYYTSALRPFGGALAVRGPDGPMKVGNGTDIVAKSLWCVV